MVVTSLKGAHGMKGSRNGTPAWAGDLGEVRAGSEDFLGSLSFWA